jgi:hypothetical protein
MRLFPKALFKQTSHRTAEKPLPMIKLQSQDFPQQIKPEPLQIARLHFHIVFAIIK